MNIKSLAKPFLSLAIPLALLIPLAWPSLVSAAEFESKLTVRNGNQAMRGYVYVSGEKVRMDMYGQEGTVITLSRPDKGLTWIVNVPRKEYLEIPGLSVNPLGRKSPQEWDKIAEKKSLEVEKYEGYLCDKTLYTFFDKKNGTVLEWKAQQLDYTIKFILYNPQGVVTTELSEIKEESIDDVAFEIPEGYRKISKKDISGKGAKHGQD